MYKIMYAIVVVLFLSSCTSTFNVAELDKKTGYFPAKKSIEKKNFIINEKVSISKYNLIYVRNENEFLKRSIINLHIFENVAVKDDFGQILVRSGAVNNIQNIAIIMANIEDPTSLHEIQKYYGDFLVVELNGYKPAGSMTVQGWIKVMNPASGQTLFEVRSEASGWLSMDEYLFYPLLNAFYDWVKSNSTNTMPARESVN